MQQGVLLQQCTQRQLEVQKGLHQLACQEAVLIKEKTEHEHQYDTKDVQERMQDAQRELCLARMEGEQLKLEGLRQRKQKSILRLKLASAKEDADLLQRNMALLDQHSQRLEEEVACVKGSLADALQQLTDVTAAKAVLQGKSDAYQSEALQAGMEVNRLREDLKLTTGRLNTATGQAADLLQQLKGVQAENASLVSQLALSQGRDTEAAAAHKALQQALEGMRADVSRLRERLVSEEVARVAAEAAAAKSAAAAEAAADALAVKEQQMAAWRDLEQASKATATQQMQLSQAQLDSMHERATATESKLLDQITALQQQLDKERSARCAAEATNTVTAGRAATQQGALEKEVAALRQQVSQAQAELSTAKAAAAKEAKRAAVLQQDLEHMQEQAAAAAADTVDALVLGLTQGQETEDDSEQPAQPAQCQAKAAGGGGRAGGRRAAAAANKQQSRGKKAAAAAAVAATPAAQTAVFASGPAAQLSGIEEGTEDEGDEDEDAAASQQQQQGQRQQQDAPASSRQPRGAKSKAQQQIKAAAAADVTPPGAAAVSDAADDEAFVEEAQQQAARRVSPRTKVGANAGRQQSGSLTGAYAAAAAGPSTQSAQQREAAQDDQENMAPAAAAAALRPPPLGFVPQSTVTPAAALKQPGVMKAAAERLSAASMLKKLSQNGGVGPAGKPGARKRKLGAAAGNGSMDVLPSNLLMSTGFKPPKVRHLG